MAAPVDPAVARLRFATFVQRTLDTASLNGMSYRDIQRASGVATSTFHRWRRAEFKGLPKLQQVRAFCSATGASLEEALSALGMTDSGPAPTPEPPLPREVQIIMRRLNDPNTPESEREFIRKTIALLASSISTTAGKTAVDAS